MKLSIKFSVFLCWLIFATTLQGRDVKQDCAGTITQSKKIDQSGALSKNKKNLEKDLFKAIKKHDEESVKKLIADGVDVNAYNDDYSAIMYAIKKAFRYVHFDCKQPFYEHCDNPASEKNKEYYLSAKDIICLLLNAGAKFEDNEYWLIGYLASAGDSKLTVTLIKNKLHLLCKEFLFCAANCGNYEAFKLVLTEYPDVNIQLDNDDGSPLMAAVIRRYHTDAHAPSNVKIVKALLDRGANVNHKNKYGESVLAIAVRDIARDANTDMIKLLLAHGTDIHSKTKKDFGPDYQADDFSRHFSDSNILKYAIDGGNKDVIELMLDQGFDLEETGSDEKTILNWTVGGQFRRNSEGINLLLSRGANPNSLDNEGRTPLINCLHACALPYSHDSNFPSPDCVATLIKFGAAPSIKDFDGKSAFDYFCQDCKISEEVSSVVIRDFLKYPRKNKFFEQASQFEEFTKLKNKDSIYCESGVSVINRPFKLNNKVSIYYPRIKMDMSCLKVPAEIHKINETLKPKFTKHYKISLKDDEFYHCDFGAWVVNNLIVIMREEYSYFDTTKIGIDKQKSFFLNAETGQFYTISNLFKKDVNFSQIIAKFVCGKNKKYIKNFILKNNCFVTQDGIEIYFNFF